MFIITGLFLSYFLQFMQIDFSFSQMWVNAQCSPVVVLCKRVIAPQMVNDAEVGIMPSVAGIHLDCPLQLHLSFLYNQ